MALVVMTWFWGDKYSPHDVAKLAAGFKRHLRQPYRFVCATDDDSLSIPGVETTPIKDPGLTKQKGCFARLRLFDKVWQDDIGVEDRLANVDLDVVVTGEIDLLFNRPDPFVVLKGANASNPCPFNGSLFMLRRGAHPELWDDFTLEAASKIPFYEFPDDQGWFWHKIPDASGWNVGSPSGVYAFQKPGWPADVGDRLPAGARMVVFPGWRSPSKFKHLPWIKEHWRV